MYKTSEIVENLNLPELSAKVRVLFTVPAVKTPFDHDYRQYLPTLASDETEVHYYKDDGRLNVEFTVDLAGALADLHMGSGCFDVVPLLSDIFTDFYEKYTDAVNAEVLKWSRWEVAISLTEAYDAFELWLQRLGYTTELVRYEYIEGYNIAWALTLSFYDKDRTSLFAICDFADDYYDQRYGETLCVQYYPQHGVDFFYLDFCQFTLWAKTHYWDLDKTSHGGIFIGHDGDLCAWDELPIFVDGIYTENEPEPGDTVDIKLGEDTFSLINTPTIVVDDTKGYCGERLYLMENGQLYPLSVCGNL